MMDYICKTPLYNIWVISGQYVYNILSVYGQYLNNIWPIYKPKYIFFNVFVLYLGNIGKYLYNNCALCGSYLYNVCTLFRNYLEYMFTI